MNTQLVQKPDLEGTDHRALVIGLSCRNPLGFIYMWIHIVSFIRSTRHAPGCTEILPGITSPFRILLVSYWENDAALLKFVRSRAHQRWARFIYRHPRALNLFNETYGRPSAANYINEARGYAGSLHKKGKSL